MKLLQSSKITIPVMFFITDRNEIKDLPRGLPFIYAEESLEEHIVRLLEFEALYKRAIETGLPFNFIDILKDNGYDIVEHDYIVTCFIDYASDYLDIEEVEMGEVDMSSNDLFRQHVKDTTAYIDLDKLKELNILLSWLDDIRKAVSVNLHNLSMFNPYMYNKKHDMCVGNLIELPRKRNLFVDDISSSIPKAVAVAILMLSKTEAEQFYADILVTGRISILIPYEEIHLMDIEEIYNRVGMCNEQRYFKQLLTTESKEYDTVIGFGDNNHPGDKWNTGDKLISDEDGKKMCKWKVNKIISFHTTSDTEKAGYLRWFDCNNIEYKKNWVKYLNQIN